MRSVLILAMFVLLLISCSSDFPAAPEFEFCKLADGQCISVHVFSKSDYCKEVGGEIVNTCEETKTD